MNDPEMGAIWVTKLTGKYFATMGGDEVRYTLVPDFVFEKHSC